MDVTATPSQHPASSEPRPPAPPQFLAASAAAPPRTLIDVLRETAQAHPQAAAVDDGEAILSYAELLEAVEEGAAWMAAQGIVRGDRIGIRMPSGTRSLYLSILSALAAGAAYVPVDVDDPDERADLVFGEAGVAAVVDANGLHRARSVRDRETPTDVAVTDLAPTPSDDAWIHLHLGIDWNTQRCCGDTPQRRRLRRRRSTSVPAGRPDRPR